MLKFDVVKVKNYAEDIDSRKSTRLVCFRLSLQLSS